MLIYTRKALPKAPKRRSRAGCIYCKEKKKKCNEQHPQCDRCAERNLPCEYEPIKPRKRKRSSALSQGVSSTNYDNEQWDSQSFHENNPDPWDMISSYAYATPESYADPSTFGHGDNYGLDDHIEEIVRTNSINHPRAVSTDLVRSRSQYPDLAMIAPSPMCSPLMEFRAPIFQEFSEKKSRRALIDHFCNVLSHLVVFKEDMGNPFQQLVLPLSHASSPVLDAIFALSSAHLEYRNVVNEESSLDFHNRALRGLATLIDENQKSNREEILGAIMLLIYYEVLVQRKNSNIVHSHLKGAMTVLNNQTDAPSPTSLFLERAFRFYDVIAALSFGTSPVSTTSIATTPTPLSPLGLPSIPSFSPLNSVDTLLGMATDLWPIIHRLSHLLDAKRELQAATAEASCGGGGNNSTTKSTVLRTELESTSRAIELALQNWTPSSIIIPTSPPPPPHGGEAAAEEGEPLDLDPESDSRLQSILNNAESYRHAAFVYLYRDIENYPRRSARVQQHSKLALQACERVVDWAGPMSALLWPLFVSSCEAVEPEFREMARKAFGCVERRQGMNNIARAWEIVEEVWQRDDLGIETDWRNICTERGFGIVFG